MMFSRISIASFFCNEGKGSVANVFKFYNAFTIAKLFYRSVEDILLNIFGNVQMQICSETHNYNKKAYKTQFKYATFPVHICSEVDFSALYCGLYLLFRIAYFIQKNF